MSSIYTFISKAPNDICSVTLIKDFVNAINNRIHNCYEQGIKNHNELISKEKKSRETKLKSTERDF